MSTITQFPSGNTQYRIEFDYLARTFVVVTLVNSSNPALNRVLEVGRDYRFLNPTMIEMLVDQSGFDIVRIHRQTGTDLVVDFRNGSVLTASDLTNSELQAIHIAEEGRDQTVDLAKEYADAAGNSAANAKDSEDEARRIAESIKIGYITRRSFEKGFNVIAGNEVLLWEEDGEYYRWDGTLPKNVPAGSTPASTGGIGLGAWVSVGDASLRNELNTPNGASLVKTSSGESVESRFTANEVILSSNSSSIAQIHGANGGAYVGHTSRAGRIRTMDDVVNDIWHINDFILAGETSWENAFNRVAASGVGAVRLSGSDYALWGPVIVDSPTKLIGAGRGRTRLIKAHTGTTLNVRHSNFELSDLSFIQDESVGANNAHIYLNSSFTSLENIRISNIIQAGGSANFLVDNGGSNLIVDLALNDIKLQGTVAAGIILTKAFAYLDLTKVTVNYVPSGRKNFIGISITGNEGSNFRWCHVNTGITSALPGSYGFAFSNCKAVWMDSCQADTVGVDGFRFDNCQYVYGSKLSASLCGGFGFALNGGSNFMLSDCYAGGRRGLAYDGGAGNMGYNVTATRAFINNSLAINCAGYGYAAASGSSVMRGGAFANNANDYSLTGANYVRGVMNAAGALIDAG